MRLRIKSSCRLDTLIGGLPALLGAAITKVTGGVMDGRVAALPEVAIAGCLIDIGRCLIASTGLSDESR